MINAKVVADSKNDFGNRITTMVVTMPRIILAEFNTHRMLSKNSASSRAIPFEKMVKSVEENPFIPIAWQKDHKGMQGDQYLDEERSSNAESNWRKAAQIRCEEARLIYANYFDDEESRVTKQLVNRLLEPFMYHTVIVTATEWENFFALRCPRYVNELGGIWRSKKDYLSTNIEPSDWLTTNKGQAEIHMMALAEAMWDAYNESTPKELKAGEWHIPFGDNMDESEIYRMASNDINYKLSEFIDKALPLTKIKIATARCARVSYTVVGEEDKKLVQEITDKNIAEGKGHKWESVDYQLKEQKQYENDIKLHDRLAESGHWSPFEHCAQVNKYLGSDWSGNFRGFVQYRKMFNNENIN